MKEPTKINFEEDRMESVSQIDASKSLSNKVIELKTMEDEIQNAENSLSKLKEKAKVLSQIEIPQMMDEMQITKLKLRDGESVELKKFTAHLFLMKANKRLFNGFENTTLEISLKTISPLPLVVAKTTRLCNMLTLQRVRGLSRFKKSVFIPRLLKQ